MSKTLYKYFGLRAHLQQFTLITEYKIEKCLLFWGVNFYPHNEGIGEEESTEKNYFVSQKIKKIVFWGAQNVPGDRVMNEQHGWILMFRYVGTGQLVVF